MSMLRKYFDEAERRYNYRIKVIIELDEQALDDIEKTIIKYNPHGMSSVSKTILHRNPLDFPNVAAAEVYSVDITLGVPASPSVLVAELANAMGIHQTEIVVRGENDPTEVENQRIVASEDINIEAKGDDPETLLDTALEYPEHDVVDGASLAGNTYNGNFLKTLKQVAAERKNYVQKTHDYDDVSSDVEPDDGPQPVLDDNVQNAETSKHGNLDDNTKTYARVYKNGRVIKKDGVAVKRG